MNSDFQNDFDNTKDKIEKIKKLYLKKSIALEDLPDELYKIIRNISDNRIKQKLKNYTENLILLNFNVKSSQSFIINTSFSFIGVIFTINNLISELNYLLITSILLILLIAITLIVFKPFYIHLNGYSKEKTFYTILLKNLNTINT